MGCREDSRQGLRERGMEQAGGPGWSGEIPGVQGRLGLSCEWTIGSVLVRAGWVALGPQRDRVCRSPCRLQGERSLSQQATESVFVLLEERKTKDSFHC